MQWCFLKTTMSQAITSSCNFNLVNSCVSIHRIRIWPCCMWSTCSPLTESPLLLCKPMQHTLKEGRPWLGLTLTDMSLLRTATLTSFDDEWNSKVTSMISEEENEHSSWIKIITDTHNHRLNIVGIILWKNDFSLTCWSCNVQGSWCGEQTSLPDEWWSQIRYPGKQNHHWGSGWTIWERTTPMSSSEEKEDLGWEFNEPVKPKQTKSPI